MLGLFQISHGPIIYIDADDIRDVDLTQVHNLSGPVAVEGAEPGDALVVDILDSKSLFSSVTGNKRILSVHAFENMQWGYTV